MNSSQQKNVLYEQQYEFKPKITTPYALIEFSDILAS